MRELSEHDERLVRIWHRVLAAGAVVVGIVAGVAGGGLPTALAMVALFGATEVIRRQAEDKEAFNDATAWRGKWLAWAAFGLFALMIIAFVISE